MHKEGPINGAGENSALINSSPKGKTLDEDKNLNSKVSPSID